MCIIKMLTSLTKIFRHHARHTEEALDRVDMTMDTQLHLVHTTERVELRLRGTSLLCRFARNGRFCRGTRSTTTACEHTIVCMFVSILICYDNIILI